MSNRFEQQVINEINKFRANPLSIKHQCEVVKKGFSRLRAGDPFLDDIANFIKELNNLNSMPSLELNEVLSTCAKEQLQLFISSSNYQTIQDTVDLKGSVPDYYLSAEPCLIADFDVDEAVTFVTKTLLNKMDKVKKGRSILCDPKYTQIGLAQTISENENYIVVIFATQYISDEPEYPLPEGDLSELKKAFDILDVDGKESLNMRDTMSILKSMNFQETDPTLYSIFSELANRTYCSWPKFAYFAHSRMTDRQSDEGLKTIFNLFIDDPKKQTITFDILRKICKELGAEIDEKTLKDIMKECTINGNEITFEEFADIMKKVEDEKIHYLIISNKGNNEKMNIIESQPQVITTTKTTKYGNNTANVTTVYTKETKVDTKRYKNKSYKQN